MPEFLAQIPEGEQIATVAADGAYDTRRCHTAIINRGAGTHAVIPIRRNGRAWKEEGFEMDSTAREIFGVGEADKYFGNE